VTLVGTCSVLSRRSCHVNIWSKVDGDSAAFDATRAIMDPVIPPAKVRETPGARVSWPDEISGSSPPAPTMIVLASEGLRSDLPGSATIGD
jgi:hypothetical protein